MIEPAVPIETCAATLFRVGADTSLPIAPPAGSLPGGYVDIALSDTLAPPLAGVRDYMAIYPYDCFDQQTSRAVALGDIGRWQALVAAIPTSLDDDGLLRYWLSERMPRSPELTPYVLAVTAANGLALPAASNDNLIPAPHAHCLGQLARKSVGSFDNTPVPV